MSAPDARSLFAAARADGPDDEARDDMFRRVGLVTGMAGATATAAAAASTAPAATAMKAAGSALSMKLLAIGGLIGAAGTALGVLLTFAIVEPETGAKRHDRPVFTTQNGSVGEAGGHARAPTIGAKRAEGGLRVRDPEQTQTPIQTQTPTPTPTPTQSDTVTGTGTATGGSDLAEEVRLVTEARRALMGGDPARALAMVQATRKLASRSMEPEELGLEARALRALGRADEAAATELVLRRRFPDHALAR